VYQLDDRIAAPPPRNKSPQFRTTPIASKLLALVLGASLAAAAFTTASATTLSARSADSVYREIGLSGQLDSAAFNAAYRRLEQQGLRGGVVAIADMTQPSTAKRLYVIDLDSKKLILRTYVAHGQNTGDVEAKHFSNKMDSHQTSLGLYRVGSTIRSPKHGAALLLDGLDQPLNGMARAREIIIHGADYVSEAFIAARGRLGRSWGCPAVSRADMPKVIESLANGGHLFVFGG
jgi:hypothetical protein